MSCVEFVSADHILNFFKNVDYLAVIAIVSGFFIYYLQRKREAKENYDLLIFLVLEQGARIAQFGELLDERIKSLSQDTDINLVLPLQDQLNSNILDRVNLPAAIRHMRSNVDKRNALYSVFNYFNTYKTIDHVIDEVIKSSHEILKLYNKLQRTFKELEAHLKLDNSDDTTVQTARDFVIKQCKELPVYNSLQLKETNLTLEKLSPILLPLLLINPKSDISVKCQEIFELAYMIESIKKHTLENEFNYLKKSTTVGVDLISKFDSIAL